ncbi:MAG TPA: hypothetical protein VI585_17720 [Candidatus Binatia bacterium]
MTAQQNSSEGGTRRHPAVRRRKIWAGPIALLLVVAALWWQWAQTRRQSHEGNNPPGVHSPAAAAISGVWQGDVTYSGGVTHTERFLFQAEGDKLFGTASFLALKRGIENGRIDGGKISFTVRFNEALEGMSTERTNRYTGVLTGGEIHFRMQDDKGGLPIEFIVRKDGQVG